jgi:hypothetical protein
MTSAKEWDKLNIVISLIWPGRSTEIKVQDDRHSVESLSGDWWIEVNHAIHLLCIMIHMNLNKTSLGNEWNEFYWDVNKE